MRYTLSISAAVLTAVLLLPVSADAGEYHLQIDGATVPRASHNPSPDEQTRLRVEWDKPRTERHNRVIISGTLFVQSDDGISKKPIDWIQPVTVSIARHANTRPSWDKKHDDSKTYYVVGSQCYTREDGRFSVQFDASEIYRAVDKAATFQVGISLGEKYGTTMVWKLRPILPQSIQFVSIAGPKSLTETQRIVNAAPSIDVDGFDPVALIRAVNHLHSIGNEKAITALREFLKIANDDEYTFRDRDPRNIDTSDPWCVYPIVMLLFDPVDPAERRPDLSYGDNKFRPTKSDESLWPYLPLAVHEDVPFLTSQKLGIQLGIGVDPLFYVEWAEKHGKLRKSKLEPADDPLGAAEAFLSHPRTKRHLDPERRAEIRELVRRQAWRTVDHIIGPVRNNDFEKAWLSQVSGVKGNRLWWNAEEQCYSDSYRGPMR